MPLVETPEIRTRDRLTAEAFGDPQVGDRYHEMYSVWWYVVAVEPEGRIAIMKGVPPCTLPTDGTVAVFSSHREFRKYFEYGSIPGYWASLADRGNSVGGWFQGWPAITGPADCQVCAQHLAHATPAGKDPA